jgi:hypothetical protein
MITQLRDVSATRQSAEMAVENHQEPASGEVHKMVAAAPAVLKVKRERRFACQIFHPNPLSCNLPTTQRKIKPFHRRPDAMPALFFVTIRCYGCGQQVGLKYNLFKHCCPSA